VHEVVVAKEARVYFTLAVKLWPVFFTKSIHNETRVTRMGLCKGFPEPAKHPVGSQPGEEFLAEVGPMTAPWIFQRFVDHAGPYRIEVNVADQLQKIAVASHQYGLVPPLKKVAGFLFSPVDPAGVTK
jgi:hypothetical protein